MIFWSTIVLGKLDNCLNSCSNATQTLLKQLYNGLNTNYNISHYSSYHIQEKDPDIDKKQQHKIINQENVK